MLPVFFASQEITAEYELIFGYRKSTAYVKGMLEKVRKMPQAKPLLLPDLPETPSENIEASSFPYIVLRSVRPALALLILLYDVVYLYFLFLKVQPNLVHINNGGYPGAISPRAAVLAAKAFGRCKIVFVVNNLASGYSRWSRWFDYPIDRIIARWVDIFVTGSFAAKTELDKVMRLPDGKAQPIPNGIEMPSMTRPSHLIRNEIKGEKYKGVFLGVVARLERRKGHHVLIQAIRLMHERNEIDPAQAHFIFKGDGPACAELKKLVSKNAMESYVTFITDTKNPADIIAALDIVILPSVANEDFPFVILEAMALGKPIIATNIAGIPEQIVADKSGLVVSAHDAESLAHAIGKLLSDPGRAAQLGAEAALRFSRNFTAELSAVKYLELYNRLLRGESMKAPCGQ